MTDGPLTLVISLPAASARRTFQIDQLKLLGLRFSFLDAITPDIVHPEEMDTRKAGWARPLRPSEVACLLSHREAWKHTAESVKPTFILEDDAVLHENVPRLLSKLETMTGVDYINLETYKKPKLLTKATHCVSDSEFRLAGLVRDRAGAAAYLLWPSGAKKLLDYTENFSPLADAAINIAPGLTKLQVEPAAAIQAFLIDPNKNHYSSTSSGQRPDYPSWLALLKGKLRRLQISFLIGQRQIKMVGRASNRFVAFDQSKAVMTEDKIASI